MFLCELNSFCFCISLECGTLIIGVLVILGSLIEFIRELVLENPSVILLIASVIYSYLGIFLILGVNMRRPEYLMPWLVVQFVALTVILIGIFYVFVLFVQFTPTTKSNSHDRPDILYIFLTTFYVATSYMWAVVRSCYRELKRNMEKNLIEASSLIEPNNTDNA